MARRRCNQPLALARRCRLLTAAGNIDYSAQTPTGHERTRHHFNWGLDSTHRGGFTTLAGAQRLGGHAEGLPPFPSKKLTKPDRPPPPLTPPPPPPRPAA